jgi:hypothetical protein
MAKSKPKKISRSAISVGKGRSGYTILKADRYGTCDATTKVAKILHRKNPAYRISKGARQLCAGKKSAGKYGFIRNNKKGGSNLVRHTGVYPEGVTPTKVYKETLPKKMKKGLKMFSEVPLRRPAPKEISSVLSTRRKNPAKATVRKSGRKKK